MIIDVFKTFRGRMLDDDPSLGALETYVGPIVAHLNSYFYESKSPHENGRLFGSYVRGTALPGHNAIDLLYLLPAELVTYFGNTSSHKDNKIKDLMGQIFNGTNWTLDIAEADDYFTVVNSVPYSIKVWPVLDVQRSEYVLLSSLASKSGQRFRPFAGEKHFGAADALSNRNLIFLSKSARLWAIENHVQITGYMIDFFAAEYISTSPYRKFSNLYHDCLLRDFFKYLALIEPTQESWQIPETADFVYRKGSFERAAESAYHVVERLISNAIIRRDDEVRKAMTTLVGSSGLSI